MKSSFQHNLSTPQGRRSRDVRRGFTLIEVMVVLAIAAVVTSITLSGFRSLTDGHRRTTCQTNMSQLYASLRLYAADEGGAFPYFDNKKRGTGATDTERNIGLWALYTFPSDKDVDELPDVGDKPIERYVRNAGVLHCPADQDIEDEDGETINRTSLLIPDPDDSTKKIYNTEYMSYHFFDNGTPDNDDDEYLYQPLRLDKDDPKPTSGVELERWRRQLLHYDDGDFVNRPPTDNTVVTWCPWHRDVRDFDNVLFYDGSVQILPRMQALEDGSGTKGSCATLDPDDCVAGADRKPLAPK
jgi:prepilin-type N-terminal cleavage/methylation domain-containing protein